MTRYRIHSPWLNGEEANGISLLPPAVERLKAVSISIPVFLGEVSINEIPPEKSYGRVVDYEGDLAIEFAQPVPDNIDNLAPSFSIRAQTGVGENEANVVENGKSCSQFLGVDCLCLVNQDKCNGWLEKMS
jgi:hypothetical protein